MSWRSRRARETGASGECFTGATLRDTDGANGEEVAKSVFIGVAFSPEGNASDEVESGLDFAIGTIPRTCRGSSGGVARTRGPGTGTFRD